MRTGLGFVALLAACSLASCAPQSFRLPRAPIAAGPAIRVDAHPVAERPADTTQTPMRFAYAGGLALTSADTSRLHGLSDLEVLPDGRLVAVSDEGDLVRGRLILDHAGRLIGVSDMTLAPLTGLSGAPLSGEKSDSDSEGLAILPSGDLMVSFERRHRIWIYPAEGGPPHAAPSPVAPFPDNAGMEALALDPVAGPDAYVTGREDTRETWTCRLTGGCTPGLRPGEDRDGSLVAARALPAGRWAWLFRDFKPATGAVIRLLITDRAGRPIDDHRIAAPATVDNFEGLAARPRADGSVRFYLISDDNFSPAQRTLLLAFDWTPPTRH